MLKVVAALIMKDGKILIAKRSTGNKDVIGKWGFPGGKVEENETEEQAIEREIKEEFDILVRAEKFITNVISKDKKSDTIYIGYVKVLLFLFLF